MRKIIGAAFVSLDGVMQAPGGTTEDPTGGFKYSGWLPPVGDGDEAIGKTIGELFNGSFDLLLGGGPTTSLPPSGPMSRATRSRWARYSTGCASMSSRAARSR